MLEANGDHDARTGLSLAGPRSCARRSSRARSTSIRNTPGNAAFFFNKADDPVWKDLDQGYETAKKLDYEANKIVWLTPAPANNTWAIAVRKDVAEPAKLKTMTDFGRWVAGGGKIKLAGSAEFVNSPAALPAFRRPTASP